MIPDYQKYFGCPSWSKLVRLAKALETTEVVVFVSPGAFSTLAQDAIELLRYVPQIDTTEEGITFYAYEPEGTFLLRVVIDQSLVPGTLKIAAKKSCRKVTRWEEVKVPTMVETTRWECDEDQGLLCESVVLP